MNLLKELRAPYSYVHTEDVISNVVDLLDVDEALTGTGPTSVVMGLEEADRKKLVSLKGLGKEVWRGVDAQDYVNKLREEWE